MVLGVGSASGRTATITTITVEIIGGGKVTSDPSGLKCGDDNNTGACYMAFSGTGRSVDLKATPDDGWTFDSWGASYDTDICGPGTTAWFRSTAANHVVTANFAGPSTGTSTLTVSYSGQGFVHSGDIFCGATGDDGTGTGTPSAFFTDCTWTVLTGSTLTVRQTPDQSVSPGWIFAGWGGACDDTDDACTIKMNANKTLSANWVESTDVFDLSVTVTGSGRVEGGGITCHGPGSCTEQESANSTVVLKATPDDGFVFTGWAGTSCSGTSDECNLTMNSDRSVTATFAPLPKLAVTVNGNGNVSGGAGAINCGNGGVICSASFAQNATVTLIATPATGATFTGWTGACGGSGTTCTVLMNQSKSVTATFIGGTAGGAGFLLTVSVSGTGTVTGSGINCGNGSTFAARLRP